MSLGKRRPRSLRATLRPSNPIDLERERTVRRRGHALRVAVVAAGVVATAAIVYGTGPPFPYRLNQRPAREIRVNVPGFSVKNQRKTFGEVFVRDLVLLQHFARGDLDAPERGVAIEAGAFVKLAVRIHQPLRERIWIVGEFGDDLEALHRCRLSLSERDRRASE